MWPVEIPGASTKEEVHRSVSNAENTASEVRDVIIVGSGPAGYTAAVYTARANLKPLLLAGSVTAGGELMNTTNVENYPGFPEGIMGPDLMENFEKQAARFGTEIQFEDVTELDLEGDIKTVTLGTGETFQARAIILSTGSAYRELGLPNEKRLSGHGVSWCATCDGFFFKGQDIAVIGGGDSAMEEALFLTKFAKSVTVVHRRDSLKASKIMADRALAHEKIHVHLEQRRGRRHRPGQGHRPQDQEPPGRHSFRPRCYRRLRSHRERSPYRPRQGHAEAHG